MVHDNSVDPFARDDEQMRSWMPREEVYERVTKLTRVVGASGIVLFMIGFLLGRAELLQSVAPFALPFFITVFYWQREKAPFVFLASIMGAVTLSLVSAGKIAVLLIVWLCIRKVLQRLEKRRDEYIPLIAAAASLIVGFGVLLVETGVQPTIFSSAIVVIESLFSAILVGVFMQSVRILSTDKQRRMFQLEEMFCLSILIGAAVIGLDGLSLFNVSAMDSASQYFVLVAVTVGGAVVGLLLASGIGIVMLLGDLSSVYMFVHLALAGVIGGLVQIHKRLGVSLALIASTVFFNVYVTDGVMLVPNLIESLLAVTLYLLTPLVWQQNLAKRTPLTEESADAHQQYARKVRDVTADKVEQLADVVQFVAESYQTFGLSTGVRSAEEEREQFCQSVRAAVCTHCPRHNKCWSVEEQRTTSLLLEARKEMARGAYEQNKTLSKQIHKMCFNYDRLLQGLRETSIAMSKDRQYLKQRHADRQIVMDQLHGLSKVMDDFVSEIRREYEYKEVEEEQLLAALKRAQMKVESVDLISLEPGQIEMILTTPNCRGQLAAEKVLAPIVSHIIGETVEVYGERCGRTEGESCEVELRSAQPYRIHHGLASIAADGGFVSGDGHYVRVLPRGQTVCALTDGMGQGLNAYETSEATLQLLDRMLASGIDETISIRTINAMLGLSERTESFCTIDLLLVNNRDGESRFVKVGACPTFIKRGNQILKIESSSLPIGAVEQVDVEVLSTKLQVGDLLVMMSDGVYEAMQAEVDPDIWFTEKLRNLHIQEPQQVADLLLDELLHYKLTEDDMTLMALRFEGYEPQWSTIPVKDLKQLRLS
ncbi:MAG: stage II sporulation protein E [Bacilli bacterium]